MVADTIKPKALKRFAGTCSTIHRLVSLPCGDLDGGDGNIEIKAAWRRLTDNEAQSGRFYMNDVIRYEAVSEGGKMVNKWFTDRYGLVGLHIIYKTQNYPTYFFSTFEHVDNIASGIGYIDEISQQGRGRGDVAGDRVLINERDNPIPGEIALVNQIVKPLLGDTVWSNYQLVGVQSNPFDFVGGGHDDPTRRSTYYLANIVIESNEELQNFRGRKAAGTQNVPNMIDSEAGKLNMGGCMGCHGVAQLAGADFNFLIKNSPFTAPEVVGGAGVIDFIKIQSYKDVQEMLDQYVMLNGITINGAAHGAFWRDMDYTEFTTGTVPVYKLKLLNCGDAEASNLVQILGPNPPDGFPEMPKGGPYLPEEQLDSFADWVDDGCPN